MIRNKFRQARKETVQMRDLYLLLVLVVSAGAKMAH